MQMGAGVRTEAADSAPLATIDVAVLAGGLGTRLAGRLGDLPKVMAPVAGRPFLDHLLDNLVAQGVRRVVLCLGHKADAARAHLAAHPRPELDIVALVEPAPAGTAGAVAHARASLASDPVIVMNGDTFVDVDLAAFVRRFRAAGAPAGLVCAPVDSTARYGRVELDARGYVESFREKDPEDRGPGWISAGIYLFTAAMLDRIAALGTGSLERDVMQRLGASQVVTFPANGRFIDIGTPETLAAAAAVIAHGRAGPGDAPVATEKL